MEKMVELARFTYPAEAQTLVALLKSEGIDCYIRNEFSSQVMAGYVDVGGARVETLESNIPRALEIMQDNGYEIPREDEQPDQVKAVANWARHIPFLRNYALEKQILLLFLLIAIIIAGLIYANSLLVSN
ncbi:DUF2007 domain-containing protein [Parabacteroides sp. PF5-9]|uniref:putative signal transducing protein n=1 Tax=Parabacteroides sp. PF5-9 TaxID=1742404 RepID=UPI002473ED72|nr:DUF2007 domain-containing protein [Parabacteroides sp. PF5-9]MDH6358150.1 hypothetical protein [Parabacteroides sp. PF5-9]